MIRVILVDDEPFMLETIQNSIAWEAFDMTVVGTFFNGQQALEFIEKNEIDVVISDIKMPILDGEGLLRELKKIKPSVEFIILSAYNDFELVREFFKLGIFDYLTKIDISSEQTDEVLSKLQLKIMKKAVGNKSQAIMEFLRASICQLGLDTEDTRFYLLNICIPNKSNLQHFNGLVSYLEKFLEEICYNTNDGEAVFLFRENQDFEKKMRLVSQKLEEAPFKILAGTSEANVLGEVNVMMQQAKKSAAYSFYVDQHTIISFDKTPQGKMDAQTNTVIDLNYNRKFIKDNLSNTNLTKIIEQMERFFDTYKKENLSYVSLKENIMELFLYFNHLLGMVGLIDGALEENSKNIAPIIDEMDTFSKVKTLILEYIKTIHLNFQQESADGLIERVRVYIDRNFEQNLSLKQISKEFGISENYLSRLFAKENKVTFKQYVKALRIVKAKDYLKHTNLRIGEICEKLGFNNMEHFSRIFKDETGFSPSEYRKQ